MSSMHGVDNPRPKPTEIQGDTNPGRRLALKVVGVSVLLALGAGLDRATQEDPTDHINNLQGDITTLTKRVDTLISGQDVLSYASLLPEADLIATWDEVVGSKGRLEAAFHSRGSIVPSLRQEALKMGRPTEASSGSIQIPDPEVIFALLKQMQGSQQLLSGKTAVEDRLLAYFQILSAVPNLIQTTRSGKLSAILQKTLYASDNVADGTIDIARLYESTAVLTQSLLGNGTIDSTQDGYKHNLLLLFEAIR